MGLGSEGRDTRPRYPCPLSLSASTRGFRPTHSVPHGACARASPQARCPSRSAAAAADAPPPPANGKAPRCGARSRCPTGSKGNEHLTRECVHRHRHTTHNIRASARACTHAHNAPHDTKCTARTHAYAHVAAQPHTDAPIRTHTRASTQLAANASAGGRDAACNAAQGMRSVMHAADDCACRPPRDNVSCGVRARCRTRCHVAGQVVTLQDTLSRCRARCHVAGHVVTLQDTLSRCAPHVACVAGVDWRHAAPQRACMRPTNVGAGTNGRELNSGWNCKARRSLAPDLGRATPSCTAKHYRSTGSSPQYSTPPW
jgi:hypothetical protein